MTKTSTTVVPFARPSPAPQTPAAQAQPEQPLPNGAPRAALTPDRMVETYVRIRDQVAEIKQRHKDELSRYVLALAKLEGMMLDELNKAGVQSMRALGGTFFKVNRTSCTVDEWSKTLEFIRENEAWELLEARVSKTAVEALIADTGKVPPGVKISTFTDINIRRS